MKLFNILLSHVETGNNLLLFLIKETFNSHENKQNQTKIEHKIGIQITSTNNDVNILVKCQSYKKKKT
jgi:hypothetical protein